MEVSEENNSKLTVNTWQLILPFSGTELA